MKPVLLLVALVLAGCGARSPIDVASTQLKVFVESNVPEDLEFEIRIGERPVVVAPLPASSTAPNVRLAANATIERGASVPVEIAETRLGLSWSSRVALANVPVNALIAEVYGNRTLDVWRVEGEPVFD